MKLFKYTTMQTASAILQDNTMGFSRPSFFNDPFDRPVAIPETTSNPIEGVFAGIRANVKSFIWEQNTAILSLTRSMTNPLMWAHYADSHRGVVLGIDVRHAGFCDEASNMVPAHFGSVIYSRHRATGPYHSTFGEPVAVGATHRFVLSHYEKWQRLFLTKPLEWAYEEEVRVVKCINGIAGSSSTNPSGTFSVKKLGTGDLHCFHLPEGAITDVYFGARLDPDDRDTFWDLAPQAVFHQAEMDQESYAIATTQIVR